MYQSNRDLTFHTVSPIHEYQQYESLFENWEHYSYIHRRMCTFVHTTESPMYLHFIPHLVGRIKETACLYDIYKMWEERLRTVLSVNRDEPRLLPINYSLYMGLAVLFLLRVFYLPAASAGIRPNIFHLCHSIMYLSLTQSTYEDWIRGIFYERPQ